MKNEYSMYDNAPVSSDGVYEGESRQKKQEWKIDKVCELRPTEGRISYTDTNRAGPWKIAISKSSHSQLKISRTYRRKTNRLLRMNLKRSKNSSSTKTVHVYEKPPAVKPCNYEEFRETNDKKNTAVMTPLQSVVM